MPPRRRGRPAATPTCSHCGRPGHTSNICPRDDYSPDLALLTCNQCIRQVVTATGGDTNFEVYCGIQPCNQHSTLTAQPPSTAPSALATALAASTAPPAAAPPQPAAAPPPPAAAPSQPAAVPPRPLPQNSGRSNRSYCFQEIDEKYRQVVSLVNGGATLTDAMEVVGLKRRTFRRWRLVAEARLLDEPGFLNLVNRISRATLQDCETQSKTILQRASSHNRMEELFRAGVCFKYLRVF